MSKYGIVTHSKYFNFVNYGSMLQCYALQKTLDKLEIDNIVIDYCNDALLDNNIYNPIRLMRDKRILSKLGCLMSYGVIYKANKKFEKFWENNYRKTNKKITSENFNELDFDGYICGSDTIWDIDESEGFDRGFFADFECMKNKDNISYAPSIGDIELKEDIKQKFTKMFKNFRSISIRETNKGILESLDTNREIVSVLDPTLLLDVSDYDTINIPPKLKKPYILLYSREYNSEMVKYTDKLAKLHDMKVVEISLRIQNCLRHNMAYNTGIEEFLGLIKNASYVVTNSYHGLIFSLQYRKDFYIFSRNGCNNKINYLLKMIGLEERLLKNDFTEKEKINYDNVWEILKKERKKSLEYLIKALKISEDKLYLFKI